MGQGGTGEDVEKVGLEDIGDLGVGELGRIGERERKREEYVSYPGRGVKVGQGLLRVTGLSVRLVGCSCHGWSID